MAHYYLFNLSLCSLLFLSLSFISIQAANFEIVNNCPYTVWAAASPGGGRRLDRGQTWNLWVAPGTAMARIWGRTGCNFDGSGRGRCQTGDCTGGLQCTGWGVPPNTLAEFALNQYGNLDFYDISLVDGFNIPMDFYPINGGCHKISCTADINGQCPNQLRAAGGCNNPCTVFKTNEYCCTNGQGSCGPTTYSRFFKDRCRDAYSYPQDDPTSTFTCPAGSNYKVVFCPLGSPHIEMPGSTSSEYCRRLVAGKVKQARVRLRQYRGRMDDKSGGMPESSLEEDREKVLYTVANVAKHNPIVGPSWACEGTRRIILRVAISRRAPLLKEFGILGGPTLPRIATILISLKHRARVITPSGCPKLARALLVDRAGAPDGAVARGGVRVEHDGHVEALHERDVEEIDVVVRGQRVLGQRVGRRAVVLALEEAAAVPGLAPAVAGLVEGAVGPGPDPAHGRAVGDVQVPGLAGVELPTAPGDRGRPQGVRAVVDDVEPGCTCGWGQA
ncbi:thaumatin-like protein 1 [Senna tora]|nr:thaumatin-like protein 1 [Senna tora]